MLLTLVCHVMPFFLNSSALAFSNGFFHGWTIANANGRFHRKMIIILLEYMQQLVVEVVIF